MVGISPGGKLEPAVARAPRAGESRHGMAWAVAGVVLLGLVLRILDFSPFAIHQADEMMQYLEQGNRLATGYGIIPWEYRYGIRGVLIAQMLVVPFWLGHALWPGTLAGVYLARGLFMALTLLALPAAWRLGALTSPRHALVALFVAAAWYESVLFSELVLSESLSASLLLLAAALLLDNATRARGLAFAGLLLGLGVLIRPQHAVFAAVLVPLALGRRWLPVLAGGIAALLIGAASDSAMARVPYGWVVAYINMNIGAAGYAARFGTSSVLYYVAALLVHFGPAAIVILAAAMLTGTRYRPLLLASLANLAAHSAIAHKEYRFVWLSVLALLVLAAIASVRAIDALARRYPRLAARETTELPHAGPLLIGLMLMSWALLSAAAEHESGGKRAMRGGTAISELAVAAAERKDVCGIGLPFLWRAHLVPALLPREVPIALVPDMATDKGAPLPPSLAAAANALVMRERPHGAEAYAKIACNPMPMPTRQVCLFVRPGGCVPSTYWSYQATLERLGY